MMEDFQELRQHMLIDRRHGGPYDQIGRAHV